MLKNLGTAISLCWLPMGTAWLIAGAQENPPVVLEEKPAVGDVFRVSCRATLQGTLRLPPDKPAGQPSGTDTARSSPGSLRPPLPATKGQTAVFTGSTAIDYTERILEVGSNGEVRRTVRVYDRMDFRRRLGEQEQSSALRPEARRMVLVRAAHLEVPFSPDGPLTWSEIDRVRTDVFTPALAGLLPGRAVPVGEKWQASPAAVQELTDLERITDGKISCRLERIVEREGRQSAQISFSGVVSGLSEDGPSRQQLSGLIYFDLTQRLIVYLSLEGKQWLLDSAGQAVSELQGQFVLTRQRVRAVPLLSDTALRDLKLVPDEENTRLLFAEKGLSFVYPRRWTVRRADPQQIVLDERNGGTVLITLDPPAQAVPATAYQQQVDRWLAQEQATVHRRSSIERLPMPAATCEHFQYEVTLRGERLVLDYYAIRQAGGGATVAGRVPDPQRALLADLAVIARSLRRGEP